MKYTITINQKAASDIELPDSIDIIDLAITDYVLAWMVNPKRVVFAGTNAVWINLKHLIEEMPRLGIKDKGALSHRIDKLVWAGLFKRVYDETKRLYLEPTPLIERFLFAGDEHKVPKPTNKPLFKNNRDGVLSTGVGNEQQGVADEQQGVVVKQHSAYNQLASNQEIISEKPVDSKPDSLRLIQDISALPTKGEGSRDTYSGVSGVGTPENTVIQDQPATKSAHLVSLMEARMMITETLKLAKFDAPIKWLPLLNRILSDWLAHSSWTEFQQVLANFLTLSNEGVDFSSLGGLRGFLNALSQLQNIEFARKHFWRRVEGTVKKFYTAQERHSMIAMLIAKPAEFEALPDGKFRVLLTPEQYRERQAESKRKQEALKKGVAVEG